MWPDPITLYAFVACGAVALAAGVVKGMVGFAMPMVLISGMSSFLTPELALAGLIFPTLVTNGMQALRQGIGAAIKSVMRVKVFGIVGMATLIAASQLVLLIPQQLFFLVLGVPITIYAIAMLAGAPLRVSQTSWVASVGMGVVAGFFGGISGVWGPVTVAYLTAYDLAKEEHMRIQGVIYGTGAVLLVLAHSASGVLNSQTLPFSAALIIPAVIGLWIGFAIQDRMDQRVFRKATLIVLCVAGVNLIRRGLGF